MLLLLSTLGFEAWSSCRSSIIPDFHRSNPVLSVPRLVNIVALGSLFSSGDARTSTAYWEDIFFLAIVRPLSALIVVSSILSFSAHPLLPATTQSQGPHSNCLMSDAAPLLESATRAPVVLTEPIDLLSQEESLGTSVPVVDAEIIMDTTLEEENSPSFDSGSSHGGVGPSEASSTTTQQFILVSSNVSESSKEGKYTLTFSCAFFANS